MINPRWSLGIVGELTLVVDWWVLWFVPEGTPTRGDWELVGVAATVLPQRCCNSVVAPTELFSCEAFILNKYPPVDNWVLLVN
jgi:hypothetical protein